MRDFRMGARLQALSTLRIKTRKPGRSSSNSALFRFILFLLPFVFFAPDHHFFEAVVEKVALARSSHPEIGRPSTVPTSRASMAAVDLGKKKQKVDKMTGRARPDGGPADSKSTRAPRMGVEADGASSLTARTAKVPAALPNGGEMSSPTGILSNILIRDKMIGIAHDPTRQNTTAVTSPWRPRSFTGADHFNKARFWGLQSGAILGTVEIFHKFRQFFGGTAQPFHIGNDWQKDNTLHIDELLHFQGSYRLAQGLGDLYRWSGVKSNVAEWLGAGLALTTMTYLEYVDGRRLNDEASYSDLTANCLGVTFALMKSRVPLLQKVDFHVSYQDVRDPFQKRYLLNYDRITHWLAVDVSSLTRMPLEIGLGYGVKNAFKPSVRPEAFLGIGMGLGKLLGQNGYGNSGPLRWLDVYQIGLQVQIM